MFFSHRASNPCAVLIAFLGKTSFVVIIQKKGKAGGILFFDVTLDTDQYVLISLYNPDIETEQ